MGQRATNKIRRIIKRDGEGCWICGHPVMPKQKFYTMKWKGLDVEGYRPAALDYTIVNQKMVYDPSHLRVGCEQCVTVRGPLPWIALDKKCRNDGNGHGERRMVAGLRRHGNRCWMCNRSVRVARDMRRFRDEERWDELAKHRMASIDHYIPRTFGGGDTLLNRRVACWECNQIRGHATETDKLDWETWLPDDYIEMGVLFLDVAGVLDMAFSNPKSPWVAKDRLNRITAETGAVIVVSSDYMKRFDMETGHPVHPIQTYRPLMYECGIEGEIIGCTFQPPESTLSTRCAEIQEWLDTHPRVTSYAILDDMPLDEYGMADEMKDHFVRVRNGVLFPEDADRAIEILRGDLA